MIESLRPSCPVPNRSKLLGLLAAGSLCCAMTASHADSRASHVVDAITAHDTGLSAAVRREKYTAMQSAVSAFYRATPYLFFADLGTSTLLSSFGGSTTLTFLQGDTHPDNFGAFDNRDGTIVYDLNDSDESVIGDYQLDLWRLSASLVLLARENGGFSAADEDAIVDACSGGYLDALASYVGSDDERTRTWTADNAYGLLDDFLAGVAGDSRKKLLDKYTTGTGGRRFDLSNPDLAAVPDSVARELTGALPAYGATLSGGLGYSGSYFRVKSVAQRLHAGLSSLGTPRYYLLIEGPSSSDKDDRILDLKAESAPAAFVNLSPLARAKTDAASGGDAAVRVNLGTHALGYRVDDHAGTLEALGLRFFVRERSPYKETFDTSQLTTLTRITKLAEQWGAVLATAHARADRDFSAALIPYDFEAEVMAKIGSGGSLFKAHVRQIAQRQAYQAQADYQSFRDWLSAHPLP